MPPLQAALAKWGRKAALHPRLRAHREGERSPTPRGSGPCPSVASCAVLFVPRKPPPALNRAPSFQPLLRSGNLAVKAKAPGPGPWAPRGRQAGRCLDPWVLFYRKNPKGLPPRGVASHLCLRTFWWGSWLPRCLPGDALVQAEDVAAWL